MTRPLSRARSLALAALAALAAAAAPAHAQYAFTPIALSVNGFDPFSFGTPSLNAGGAVAFTAGMDRLTSVFRYDAGSLTTIASTRSTFTRFGDVSINTAGQVGFEGSFRNITGEGIFRGDGGSVVTIAGTRSAGAFDFVNAGPSLNALGSVAFNGALKAGFVDGIYVGNGGPVTPLYDDRGPADNFNDNPSLNDLGYVAFSGGLAGGPNGIFLGNGGPLTTLADNSNGFFTFFFGPSLNENNDVAFYAATNGGTAHGIFFSHAGVVTPVVQGDFSQFASLGFDPSLNNVGQVAYIAEPTFGNQILAVGADPVAGRVLGTGDLLFGRAVAGIALSREGLNDSGQLAFTAFFDDGSAGVFLATPTSAVPEPESASMLATALVLLGLAARWQRRTV